MYMDLQQKQETAIMRWFMLQLLFTVYGIALNFEGVKPDFNDAVVPMFTIEIDEIGIVFLI
ncbi:hypothetical protein BD408DRAFT_177378 [Parasitella parasitica]|nr:hypothetical protein BD408DRAFT_177378 [Parasitella parasitica]